MHPMLKPALRRCWRDRSTLQFGVSPAHAVVVGPVDTATGSFLQLLDGTRGMPLLRREAAATGLGDHAADALVDRLAAAGLLDDATAAADAGGDHDGAAWDRLRPDLAALSLRHPDPGDAWRRMEARQGMRVQVRGAGRVGAAVAAGLSAAGVGRVEVMDGGCVEPWDVSPAGFSADAIGRRRDAAARRLVRAAAPSPRPREEVGGGVTGWALVVHAPRDGLAAHAPDPVQTEELLASGTPHLYTGIIENSGVVGPLVLPGESACTGCLALEREAREPGWSRMVAQWRSGRATAVHACDSALAAVVAGTAVAHALAFLDGGLPPTVGARLELAPPEVAGELHRITPQSGCPCGAAGAQPLPASDVPSPAVPREEERVPAGVGCGPPRSHPAVSRASPPSGRLP